MPWVLLPYILPDRNTDTIRQKDTNREESHKCIISIRRADLSRSKRVKSEWTETMQDKAVESMQVQLYKVLLRDFDKTLKQPPDHTSTKTDAQATAKGAKAKNTQYLEETGLELYSNIAFDAWPPPTCNIAISPIAKHLQSTDFHPVTKSFKDLQSQDDFVIIFHTGTKNAIRFFKQLCAKSFVQIRIHL